jgi:hypothetical protein
MAILPPLAAAPDEYHDLKVRVKRPDVVVKTDTGYYNEPPTQFEGGYSGKGRQGIKPSICRD